MAVGGPLHDAECRAGCSPSHPPFPLQLPELKVVMEHITTADAAHFVAAAPANVGASVTPQASAWQRALG